MKRKTKLEKIQDALLSASAVRKRLWKVIDSEPPFENASIKDKLKAINGLTDIELNALEDTRRGEFYLLVSDGATLKEAVEVIHEKYDISRKRLYDDWQLRDTWLQAIVDEEDNGKT